MTPDELAQVSLDQNARGLIAYFGARHTARAVTSKLPRGCFDNARNARIFHAEIRLAEVPTS